MRLLVGDDWAEDHHDIEVMDSEGHRLDRARLEEGVAGIVTLHEMVAHALGDETEQAEVLVGIETDRGPWVQALIAAGYRVFAINPLQVTRYRERHSVSGAKSDVADAHTLADMVRTDAHQLRPVAADTSEAAAIKVTARAHKRLIWERTRHTLRLRHALREYFPAALEAFTDFAATDTLQLLDVAPDPDSAAQLTINQITGVLRQARRRQIETKATAIQATLRREQLRQPEPVTAAYAAVVRAQVAILTALSEQIETLHGQVETHFGQHPDAEIVTSQPGLGTVLGARVLAEFGDADGRYASAKARKNYAGTSPITRQSGKKKTVLSRWVHNDRLVDALHQQAFAALNASPGARAYYDRLRTRGVGHRAALRQLSNRLVGILHGCLKTRTPYDETTAWNSQSPPAPA